MREGLRFTIITSGSPSVTMSGLRMMQLLPVGNLVMKLKT